MPEPHANTQRSAGERKRRLGGRSPAETPPSHNQRRIARGWARSMGGRGVARGRGGQTDGPARAAAAAVPGPVGQRGPGL